MSTPADNESATNMTSSPMSLTSAPTARRDRVECGALELVDELRQSVDRYTFAELGEAAQVGETYSQVTGGVVGLESSPQSGQQVTSPHVDHGVLEQIEHRLVQRRDQCVVALLARHAGRSASESCCEFFDDGDLRFGQA